MQRYVFTILAILSSIHIALAAPELETTPHGDFHWEGKDYTVEFAPDGQWKSLHIQDVEMLADNPAGYLAAGGGTLEQTGPGELTGTSGSRTMTITFTPEHFTVSLRDSEQKDFDRYPLELADHVAYIVMPAEQGQTFALPSPVFRNAYKGARMISTKGPALQTDIRTSLNPRTRCSLFFYVDPAKGRQITFTPIAKYQPTDLLFINFDAYPKNHFFPAGPLTLPTALRNASDTDLTLTVTTQLETYTPNKTGQVLETHQQDITVPAGGKADATARLTQPDAPGPYEFQISLGCDGETFRTVRGAMIYDPDGWTLPDREPDDFDAFWARTLKELRSRELDPRVAEASPEGIPGEFKQVSFNGLGERRVRGFLGVPDLTPDEKAPAILILPGAGWAAAPVDAGLVRKGYVVLSLSVHDPPFTRGRRHSDELNKRGGAYMRDGLASRETYFYRYAYAGAVRAVDYLQSLPQVDPDHIQVVGGSQGGALALAVAGLHPGVALATVSCPGRSRWDKLTFDYQAVGTFDPPAGMTRQEMFEQTLVYFDTSILARRIGCAVLMEIAGRDEVDPFPLQYYAFREIPETVDKRMWVDPWAYHNGVEGADALAEQMVNTYIFPDRSEK